VSLSDIFRNDKHFRPQMSVGIHLQEISCNITSFAAMRLIFFAKKNHWQRGRYNFFLRSV